LIHVPTEIDVRGGFGIGASGGGGGGGGVFGSSSSLGGGANGGGGNSGGGSGGCGSSTTEGLQKELKEVMAAVGLGGGVKKSVRNTNIQKCNLYISA
jgi:hypothetical protein